MIAVKDFLISLFSERNRIIEGISFFSLAILFDALGFHIASLVLFIAVLVLCGTSVYIDAVKGILRRDLLDEKFLMSIASIGAIIIGEPSEGAAVMLFFLIGEFFEHKAVIKSRNSIKAILDICPDEACVLIDGEERTVDTSDVLPGTTIVVRPGERVPIDCRITSGSSDIDTSSLTGESVPRFVEAGDALESGVIVLNGAVTCTTLRTSEESVASRILELVEEATENKAKEETFITKFSHYYTPAVVIFAVLFAIIPPLFSWLSWEASIYRALTFLVISCPCALVISVPLAFFGGIGAAASNGILFKGGNVFSAIAKSHRIAFDKTGTLTTGELEVTDIKRYGIEEKLLLSVVSSIEKGSNHPIAKALKDLSTDILPVVDMREYAGKGTVGYIDGKQVAVGNFSLIEYIGANSNELSVSKKAILVSYDGTVVAEILVTDKIREDAKSALEELKRLGVDKTVMLSGDSYDKANEVGQAVGIDEVYAELLPDEKYAFVKKMSSEEALIYVGDGINDAPSLAATDVGIAMGLSSSDSAIEAADLTVMSEKLMSIPKAIEISRKTLRIAKENIVFALGIKLLVIALSALGFANMWLAVFADVGVSVIAILNSMRAMR